MKFNRSAPISSTSKRQAFEVVGSSGIRYRRAGLVSALTTFAFLLLLAASPTAMGDRPVVSASLVTPFAAENAALFGLIADAETGEGLIGVQVLIEELQLGALTDIDGRFSIEGIEPGSYTVRTAYVGYQEVKKTITLKSGQRQELEIALHAHAIQLDAVEIQLEEDLEYAAPSVQSVISTKVGKRALKSMNVAADAATFQATGAGAAA